MPTDGAPVAESSMELGFKGIRITIVSTPFDLLASCRILSMVAQATFDIDVDKGGDLVIFVSKKNRTL